MWGLDEERWGRDLKTGGNMNKPKELHFLRGGKRKSEKPDVF